MWAAGAGPAETKAWPPGGAGIVLEQELCPAPEPRHPDPPLQTLPGRRAAAGWLGGNRPLPEHRLNAGLSARECPGLAQPQRQSQAKTPVHLAAGGNVTRAAGLWAYRQAEYPGPGSDSGRTRHGRGATGRTRQKMCMESHSKSWTMRRRLAGPHRNLLACSPAAHPLPMHQSSISAGWNVCSRSGPD